MDIEVFRFITLSPTQRQKATSNLLMVNIFNPDDNDIREALTRAGILNVDRTKIIAAAKAYLKNPDFYSNLSKLSPSLIDFIDWLNSLKTIPTSSIVLNKISQMFPEGIVQFVESADFQRDRINISVSLIVASAVPNGTINSRPQLLETFKVIAALITLSQNSNSAIDFGFLLKRTIILPKSLFPVIYDNSATEKKIQDEKDRLKNAEEQSNLAVQRLINQINLNNNALEELSNAHFQHINLLKKQSEAVTIADNTAVTRSNPIPSATFPKATKLNTSFLPSEISSNISSQTKKQLSKYFIDTELIDPNEASTKLTEQNKALVNKVLALRNKNIEITFVGKTPIIVKSPVFNAGIEFEIVPVPLPIPGPCPPGTLVNDEDLTTDKWNTKGIIPVLYIGYLQKVRQSLARYELGDIAHIENVLKGESKTNELRRLDKTLQTVVSERESQSETEKDLHTQDQYELQAQAANTIAQNKSFDAGLTVTGSYGPSITATATTNYSQQNSSEQSSQSSSRYAREIVSTSIQKIKDRILNSKTTTNIEEVKVINKHELNNAEGTDHIRGIYHWVNKIYRLQVINYDKRAMLEFTIPDPAAFYRYALTTNPNENSTVIKPDLPGSCLNGVFQPLKASDINETNYQFWASKYGVTDIKSYPSAFKRILWNKIFSVEHTEKNDDNIIGKDKESESSVVIPAGYKIEWVEYMVRAITTLFDKDHSYEDFQISFLIGNYAGTDEKSFSWNAYDASEEFSNGSYYKLFYGRILDFNSIEESLPVSVTGYSTKTFIINFSLKVQCSLTDNAIQQWQTETLNSIMDGYNKLKSQYDRDIKAQQFDNIVNIQGRNPLLNREIEKIELKKLVLSQLTGQNYDYFNSMEYNMPPLGYPQIVIVDAEDEGNYIRFFEQCFEWENMTYLFYPYFWANKKSWPMLLQLRDVDPLFEKFLQAGSARVQVPVRPGFEASVAAYIQNGGTPWLHSDAPQNEDEDAAPFLAMVDEIKAQHGFEFNQPNPGTISVIKHNDAVTGTNTLFQSNDPNLIIDNIDREIIIQGKSYRIKSVDSATSITLAEPYDGESKSDIGYYLGGKFMGEFWEELIPTELVYLTQDDLSLL